MDSGIKVVLFIVTISALLGFTQMSSTIQYAEGAVSWNGFLREIGFGGTQVYEVSVVSVIPEGETFGNRVQLRCLDGDWYLSEPTRFTMTIDPSIVDTFAVGIGPGNTVPVQEGTPGTSSSKTIGFATTPRNDGVKPPFDIPVTITGLCVSPSPLANAIGGTMIPIDNVSLVLAYGLVNCE